MPASASGGVSVGEAFLGTAGADGTGFPLWLYPAGSPTSLLGTFPASELTKYPNGTLTVYVHAKDAAGNWGAFTTGTMTIEESVAGQKVGLKLQIVKPMVSTATCALTLARTRSGSVVTWSMAGNHNFVGKAFGVFMNMDKALGADIEQGLEELKTVAEGKKAATADPKNVE